MWFIARLVFGMVVASIALMLLVIALGSHFGDKNQLIVPTWDSVHNVYQIAFADLERNVTYFQSTDQGQQNPIEGNLAWSPDGRQIAFDVLAKNDTQIEIIG